MRTRSERLLWVVLVLNLALVTGLVVVGLTAHSLGVLAAGVDYLADSAAIGVSLLAIRLVHPRATTVAALVNAGWLLALNAGVVVAAIGRLATGAPEVQGLPVLIASAVAALVMGGGALLLGGEIEVLEEEEDLNLKSILLDTAGDAAAAAGVAGAGAVILATGGWYWLDPAVALAIALVVGYHALALIAKAVRRLRSATPPARRRG
jgi:cobalt-zinc-cadmium efflux system protein